MTNIFSIRLDDKEQKKLLNFMKENNIKTKSKGIKKCLEIATNQEENLYLIRDIWNKVSNILYKENANKKLIEQLFVNMGFAKNMEIKSDKCLDDFYEKNRSHF